MILNPQLAEERHVGGESLSTMYALHGQFILAIARRILGDDDAHDGVQEVFLRLARQSGGYRGDAAIRTWLYRITVNTCLNLAKPRATRWKRCVPLDDEPGFTGRDIDLDLRIDLGDALAKLTSEQRFAFLMHDLEGYNHAEIGAACGKAEGTSKSRLFDARQTLRGLLAE